MGAGIAAATAALQGAGAAQGGFGNFLSSGKGLALLSGVAQGIDLFGSEFGDTKNQNGALNAGGNMLLLSKNPWMQGAGVLMKGMSFMPHHSGTTIKDESIQDFAGIGDFSNQARTAIGVVGGNVRSKKLEVEDKSDLKAMESAAAGSAMMANKFDTLKGLRTGGRQGRNLRKAELHLRKSNDIAGKIMDMNSIAVDASKYNGTTLASANASTLSGVNTVRSLYNKQGGTLYEALSRLRQHKERIASKKKGGELQDAHMRFVKEFTQKWFEENVINASTDPLKFQDGGTMNVIPTGSLHARLHHMDDDERITKKGIPVVDASGALQAEIERDELILTKEVTDEIEDMWRTWQDAETDDEKMHICVSCGKYFANQILNNTDDKTGLIKKVK